MHSRAAGVVHAPARWEFTDYNQSLLIWLSSISRKHQGHAPCITIQRDVSRFVIFAYGSTGECPSGTLAPRSYRRPANRAREREDEWRHANDCAGFNYVLRAGARVVKHSKGNNLAGIPCNSFFTHTQGLRAEMRNCRNENPWIYIWCSARLSFVHSLFGRHFIQWFRLFAVKIKNPVT